MEAKKRRLENHWGVHQHRLLQALSCGVVALLSGAETMRTLSTCRAIRFSECVAGWALRSATQSPRWQWVERRVLTGVATSAYPKMLEVAWRIDGLLITLSAHPTANGEAPVLLQGFLLLDEQQGVKKDDPQAVAARSCGLQLTPGNTPRFKAHWDKLHTLPDSKTLVCKLCQAAVESICSYREETERFANDLEEKVLREEERWEAEGRDATEVFELSYDFQQACFENESYYDAYVANQSDESVLRHVVAGGRFSIDGAVGCPRDLVGALSAPARETCREVYQPLRELLAAMCGSQVAHAVAQTADGAERDVVVGSVACGLSTRLLVGCVVSPA